MLNEFGERRLPLATVHNNKTENSNQSLRSSKNNIIRYCVYATIEQTPDTYKMISVTTPIMVNLLLVLMTMLLWMSPASEAYKLVDLTHPVSATTWFWPGVPTLKRTVLVASKNNENVWFELGKYVVGEHGGTHIDVPRHFKVGALDLKDFPLESTIAEGVFIDCSKEAAADPNYAMPKAKLQEWEKKNGRIPNEAAVLVHFGYAKKFSDPKKLLNTNDPSDPPSFRFPYIHVDAAKWLVSDRNIKMLGTDCPSPDQPQDIKYPVHSALLPEKNKMIIEMYNVPHEGLPPRNFRVHASPIRMQDGTGIQTRIYAMIHEKQDDVGSVGTVGVWSPQGLWVMLACVAATSALARLLTGDKH